ncbi:hypothetical protein HME9302_02494 [Alteripontixanthobacter maritimus]|uniref:Inner membrane protein YqiJ n=1 Tax=Alteripontixanthobacter maritimus TaxID=2161824 RepID=A0A369Q8P4_9SPHN|nr:OB-fold-containig protein [Alteripontixanthobacter maritimus]RDC61273.1 hypothetical protein HME9302_02494 [Alteripontixanthobacter maritimus]
MTLLADYNLPFSLALAVMLALLLLQMVGIGDLLDGTDAEMDPGFDADGATGGGPIDGLMSVAGLGRVPFMIWLSLLLLSFALIGISGQMLAVAVLGAPVLPWLAALGAGAAAVPVTGALARPLGRILPQDETTAVTVDSLLGRRAHIQTGTARRASSARAKVIDLHGHPHFVMVEPHDDTETLQEGEQVLLVRREGDIFFAQSMEQRNLSP